MRGREVPGSEERGREVLNSQQEERMVPGSEKRDREVIISEEGGGTVLSQKQAPYLGQCPSRPQTPAAPDSESLLWHSCTLQAPVCPQRPLSAHLRKWSQNPSSSSVPTVDAKC